MNFGILLIGCSIFLTPIHVDADSLVGDLISAVFQPQPPTTDRRHIELIASARVDNYTVLNTAGLITQFGYSAEEHLVTTVDGYILRIFRITGGPKSPPSNGKPVVFMLHGALASSDYFALIGPGYDLAYLLSDIGYDVWIGNIRGNTYGRSHVNLTVDDPEFWDHSFHEYATMDLPAMLDLALTTSGRPNLSYVGHSLGTTIVYILLSEVPEYNDKMNLIVCLAPIAFWKGRLSEAIELNQLAGPFYMPILKLLGIYDIPPNIPPLISSIRNLCKAGSWRQFICLFFNYAAFGKDPVQLDYGLWEYFAYYAPAGIAVKTNNHYMQNMNSDKFRQYDYGRRGNVKKYGTKEPPSYNLSRIAVPCALIYGDGDTLAREKSVAYLAQQIPSVIAVQLVPSPNFNHIDFVWATNAKEVLYDPVIDLIEKYSAK